MKEQEERLLRRALLDAAEQDFEDLEVLPPPASFRQTQCMNMLFASPNACAQRKKPPLWRRAAHTAAMLAITIGCSSTLIFTLSPQARAVAKQWFMEIDNTTVTYHFSGERTDETLPQYTITALPEGYEETDCVDWLIYRRISFENADGQEIRFSYSLMTEGTLFSVGSDDLECEVEDISVNGCNGQYYHSLDSEISSAIVWIDERANILFYLDAFTDKTGFLHMAESVSLVKT